MAVRALDIVDAQIVIISPPYPNVVMTVAWIGVPYIIIVGEVVRRPSVEVPVSVIMPWPPHIISVVPGDHPGAGQICIGLNLNILNIDALPAFRYHVEFHHVVNHVIVG
jgi:hypothetical protein